MTVTPMMKQYLSIKNQHPDEILFFRLGDFYEMFLEDAQVASKVLEITLTARDGGNGTKIPMCGVPYHAAETYIARLIDKGFRVAICEQVEDPRAAKGIVKREVIRIISPGTVTESSMLEESRYNFLVSVVHDDLGYGLAVVEASTGYFGLTELTGKKAVSKLIDELSRLKPVECIFPEEMKENTELIKQISGQWRISVTFYNTKAFRFQTAYQELLTHFGTGSLHGFGCENMVMGIRAAGGVISYLKDTQKSNLSHMNKLQPYKTDHYMLLDNATRRNLELTQTIRDAQKKGTLLWVLDQTVTAMGSRLLKLWLEQPLIDPTRINQRLLAVEEIADNVFLRSDVRKLLEKVYDLERLAGRVALGSANPRDMLALCTSLESLPGLYTLLDQVSAVELQRIKNHFDKMDDIYTILKEALDENPPVSAREGGIIKTGYNSEVDRLRSASSQGRGWITTLEAREKEKTGIKSLKVGFNKVFGYYIEVTNSNRDLVPLDYVRKQTLANAERYITPELKEYEETILGAQDRVIQLEYELFSEIRAKVGQEVERLQNCALMVAELDVFQSLAEAAIRNNYTKPEVTEGDSIFIQDGRHPVVEKVLTNAMFVPNDTVLDKEQALDIITGPNMAGKSTYMRQVALICLMAQIGSFVPATHAKLGVVDRIFTRVGASDDLATGQSTFMVEMNEVANILNNATDKSLVILDEIGRGTSTFDGLSIAWSVAEYILDTTKIGAKTLFATHYHELTELVDIYPRVMNHSIAVKEKGDDIIFLRKIVPGGADRSYGIQVAKLAGLPSEVLQRAKEILATLEATEETAKSHREVAAEDSVDPKATAVQLNVLDDNTSENQVVTELKELNVLNLTPLDALNTLYKLHKMVNDK